MNNNDMVIIKTPEGNEIKIDLKRHTAYFRLLEKTAMLVSTTAFTATPTQVNLPDWPKTATHYLNCYIFVIAIDKHQADIVNTATIKYRQYVVNQTETKS